MTILNDLQIGLLSQGHNFIYEQTGQQPEPLWFPPYYDIKEAARYLIQQNRMVDPELSRESWHECNQGRQIEIGFQLKNGSGLCVQKLTKCGSGDFFEQPKEPLIVPFVPQQVKEENYLSSIPFEDDPDYEKEMKKIEEERLSGGFMCEMRSYRKTKKVISFGLSSYGYDFRLGNKFKIFTNVNNSIVDPKNFDTSAFVDFEGDVCIIPPNSFVLASTLEKVNMPRNVTGVVLGKSTYARCGISCLATPLEAGWSGHVTLEFANTTPLPAKLYAGEGCCQVVFYAGEAPLVSYADRGGKYMNQAAEPVAPRL